MTSATERAVEAGARAIVARNGGDWDETPKHWQDVYRADVATALLAAFPIQAEELVAWHDEQAAGCDVLAAKLENAGEADRMERIAESHRRYAHHLRARIQQMAEAL